MIIKGALLSCRKAAVPMHAEMRSDDYDRVNVERE